MQDPRLKIKEDLLHKLSRDHLLEGWKERQSGLSSLPGAEESGQGLRRGQPRHGGQAGEMLWGQMPQQL